VGLRHLALRLSYTTQTRGQALDLRSGEAELENQSTPGVHVCVFITAVPIIKLFARGEGDSRGHVLRETTSRGLCGLVCPSRTSERGGERDEIM
jgi:hypothetical protein